MTSEPVEASWNRATVAEDPSDPLLGVTLSDTYVVERMVGEGGMGRVYLARHTRITQKRVAVKVLRSEYASNKEVLARFQREAEASAAVSHPNVITVLDVARTPLGQPYLVCEYLEGIDLYEHVKAVGKLDVGAAVHVARQICRGLAAAHKSGVVHRDLKPQNVFLVGDFSNGAPLRPAVKILDFGLSRFLDPNADQLTQSGVIMGTPSYMAPEQARAQPVDNRADIYGVGAILYTALTGQPPFLEETPHETILAVLNREPRSARSLEPSIPEALEIIINHALARDPEHRFKDARSMEMALEAFESRQHSEPVPPPAALPAAPSLRVNPVSLLPEPLGVDPSEARVVLLFYLLCAFALFAAAAMTSVPGVELATGYSFNHVETGLYLVAVLTTAVTPSLLWLWRIRRRVLGSTSECMRLLTDVRATVLTFVLAYGLSMLSLQIVDGGLVRLFGTGRVSPAGASWAGWNLLLPLVALVAAGGQLWVRRISATVESGWKRILAIWSVASLLVMTVGSLIVLGLHWRESAPSESVSRARAPAAATPAAPRTR